jgi:hypothetical protein
MNLRVFSSKPLQIALCILSILASLALIVLPVIGAKNYFVEFHAAYSRQAHAMMLVDQATGPVAAFLAYSCTLAMLCLSKRLSWLLLLIGVAAPIYTYQRVGGYAHDFSHAVFNECSGIYGIWIFSLCLPMALFSVAMAIAEFGKRQKPMLES